MKKVKDILYETEDVFFISQLCYYSFCNRNFLGTLKSDLFVASYTCYSGTSC